MWVGFEGGLNKTANVVVKDLARMAFIEAEGALSYTKWVVRQKSFLLVVLPVSSLLAEPFIFLDNHIVRDPSES